MDTVAPTAETAIYEELEEEVLAYLEDAKLVTLATSTGDRVTARTVSIVHDGLTIFFQSEESMTKNEQIAANPNVAISASAFRLEGEAREIGRPLDHAIFAHLFAAAHPYAFAQFSGRSVTRLFEIRPRLVSLWKFDAERGPYEDFLDVESRGARRRFFFTHEEWLGLQAAGG